MKIRILRSTVANGVAVNVGQVVDTTDADAQYLIQLGKAARVDVADSSVVETADAAPVSVETTAKAQPKSRGKGKS